MTQNDEDSASSIPYSLKKLLSPRIGIDTTDYSSELAEDASDYVSSSGENNTALKLSGKADELKKWFSEKFAPSRSLDRSTTKEEKSGRNNYCKNNERGVIIKARTNPELLLNRMLETCMNFEPGILELEEKAFFETDQAVWILGDSYNTIHDKEQIKSALRSVLWFTYRKNFAPIGGTGPTSDQGWGCMLRCGQMLLAQTLIRRHLGTWWRWDPLGTKDQQYLTILSMFQDKKSQMYSIHQIAQMGVSEGKQIGEWFGPNTVAHVLKKLTVYDDWSALAVHVAMDSAVVLDHVRTVCHSRPRQHHHSTAAATSCATSQDASCVDQTTNYDRSSLTDGTSDSKDNSWRPLLLVIPLRLGLANLNPVYIPALKEFFMLKQCLGAIGGRPNHALYFVGTAGDELLYLDPHYCQQTVDLDMDDKEDNDDESSLESTGAQQANDFKDSSFHCPYILHMPIANIDPSLALAFYCQTESELEDLCACFRKGLFKASDPPMFELMEKAPPCWPKFVPYAGEDATVNDFAVVDSHFDTDEEFEILD